VRFEAFQIVVHDLVERYVHSAVEWGGSQIMGLVEMFTRTMWLAP